MGPRRASDATTKSELINNIDIRTSLIFVNCNILNKTRKGSCWRKSHSESSEKHLLWASLVGTDSGFLCADQAQTWYSSCQIQPDVHPRQQCFCACVQASMLLLCLSVQMWVCTLVPGYPETGLTDSSIPGCHGDDDGCVFGYHGDCCLGILSACII